MDKLNKTVMNISSSVLLVSTFASLNRHWNERLRKSGLKGNKIYRGSDRECVEYKVSVNNDSKKLVIFENGLGDPLEVWDYIRIFLKDDYNLFFYNRPGYGYSRSIFPITNLIPSIIEEEFSDISDIYIVGHSIGAASACALVESSFFFKNNIRKIVFIDGTEPDIFEKYREDSLQKGEFIQASFQKALAGFFGFQWWGIDKYARRTSYQPDIQQSVRLFNSSPKQIFSTFKEHESIDIVHLKNKISSNSDLITIISSSERKYQQQQVAKKFNIPIFIINDSLHHSIIGSPDFAIKVASKLREIIEE